MKKTDAWLLVPRMMDLLFVNNEILIYSQHVIQQKEIHLFTS